jgi:hypothetical protein
MSKKLNPGDLATVIDGPVLMGAPMIRERAKKKSDSSNIETVSHPRHYICGGIEAIDVIEAFNLNFRLGNTVKYILRAGRKGDRIEDLKKAMWYLNREIEKESKP